MVFLNYKGGSHLTENADLVTTAVIVVMMGGDACYDVDAGFLSGGLDLGHVIGVDSSGLVGDIVDEKIGVVIFTNGYRYDFHSEIFRSSEGSDDRWPREGGVDSGRDDGNADQHH